MKPIKNISSIWEELYQDLIRAIDSIRADNSNPISQADRCLQECKNALLKLEEDVLSNEFQSESEEIYFFKEVKPKIYSLLIFYHKVYNIEIGKPIGSQSDREAYLQKELDRINEFFNDNKFWYQYFRSGETYLDEKLFLRNQHNTSLSLQLYDVATKPSFTTNYDYILSRIKANEFLQEYLTTALGKVNNVAALQPLKTAKSNLTWTDSKTALIELAYALQSVGSINHGKADVKQLIDFFQNQLNIDLGNTSRTFQEILSRKSGHTHYIDRLRAQLLHRIDKIDER